MLRRYKSILLSHSQTLECSTVKVWEWIWYFIPYLKVYTITYSCSDLHQTMLVKEVDLHKMFPKSIRIKEVSYIIKLTPCMPSRIMRPLRVPAQWRQLCCKDILQIFCFHVVKVGDVKEQLQLVSPEDRFPADSRTRGANVGPTWGRQDPGGPHVGHMNLAIRVVSL